MSERIDTITQSLDNRIDTIKDEIYVLTEARAALTGQPVVTTESSSQRALRYIYESGRPVTAANLGPALGLHHLAGYGLTKKLGQQGLAYKEEGLWYLTMEGISAYYDSL
jgi:hypothetical protein